MRITLPLVFLAFFLSACVYDGDENMVQISSGGTEVPAGEEPKNELPHTEDGVYRVQFDALGTQVLHVQHEARKPLSVYFVNEDAKSIETEIRFSSGETLPNLRLSYITKPDGTTDGPFGTHTAINLDQTGEYMLTFSENQMAGDPWSGEADIVLTLSDQEYPEGVKILN